MIPFGGTAYLAAKGFEADLAAELGDACCAQQGRLFLTTREPQPAAWAQNVWFAPQCIPIASIGQGAKALKALQRNWALYSFHLHRRGGLIQDKLPPVSARPHVYGTPAPTAPLGSWTLLDEGTILASQRCSSPFPHGEARFAEDRQTPPNRAYLKLWELFTLTGVRPGPGETCLDLGSSPGGWSWVLQQTGARVISVDKAPLAPDIAALPGIDFRRMSAFALEPKDVGPVDWLFSDVICYPERLLKLVERWRASGLVRNFACTIKFQADTDHDVTRRFAEIPGSRLLHLFHNKHELTWINLESPK